MSKECKHLTSDFLGFSESIISELYFKCRKCGLMWMIENDKMVGEPHVFYGEIGWPRQFPAYIGNKIVDHYNRLKDSEDFYTPERARQCKEQILEARAERNNNGLGRLLHANPNDYLPGRALSKPVELKELSNGVVNAAMRDPFNIGHFEGDMWVIPYFKNVVTYYTTATRSIIYLLLIMVSPLLLLAFLVYLSMLLYPCP